MDLDWPKFSAYQMRSMQSEPTPTPKPVGGNPRIMQFTQPSFGQGVSGAQMPAPYAEPIGPRAPYPTAIGPTQPYAAPIGPRAPYAAPIGPNMPYEAPIGPMPQSAAVRDLQAIAKPIGKVGSALGSFGSFLINNPVVNNPLTRTAARVAGPVGAAIGAYSAGSELLDPNSAPRQRFAAAGSDAVAGNYGSAAKNAYYGVGDVVGSATGLKPFAQYLAGKANQITMDAEGNFSRAPTNMAEYKQMMDLKPKATMATASELGIQQPAASASPAAAAAPAQSYNDWLMKQPVSKLNAADYANRVNLEIEKRAPDLAQQNFLKAASYAMSHPDMVTSEEHRRDGSWAKTYGDRGSHAMQSYGTFRDALSKEPYYGSLAQAALTKADNSEKFTTADRVGLAEQQRQKMRSLVIGDDSIPVAQRITNASAYLPTYNAARKANGLEPVDLDEFLQEQFGVSKNASGFYSKPK